ncbi:EamA family transporter [Legionella israelensis]|uniref:EamA family transporter n=1 Tax=Legionella israelensis TaxID=454 RepID=UPI00117F2ACF|nr:EamA family transporter [Legionella israelensis]QDP72383.1 EamA family transporter [Legionella israelensis]
MIYFFAWSAVLLTVISQLLMKKSASDTIKRNRFLKNYINLRIFSAYALMFTALIAFLYVFKELALKDVIYLQATTFVLIPLASHFVLHEKLYWQHLVGIGLIIGGIFIFNI